MKGIDKMLGYVNKLQQINDGITLEIFVPYKLHYPLSDEKELHRKNENQQKEMKHIGLGKIELNNIKK